LTNRSRTSSSLADRFYFYLDAFLVATRSVPDILRQCLGKDPFRKKWFKTLPDEEQKRREKFQSKLDPHYHQFSQLPASKARLVTVHESGTPPVRVKITGLWREYEGGPCKSVPTSEFRRPNPADYPTRQWWAMQSPPVPMDPRAEDFKLEVTQESGEVLHLPLFPECQKYLAVAQDMALKARGFDKEARGAEPLT
jgi:hypothetical protein